MKSQQETQAAHESKERHHFHSEVQIKESSADVEPQGGYDGDEDHLARLGKKQVLKVCDSIRDRCSRLLIIKAKLRGLVYVGF